MYVEPNTVEYRHRGDTRYVKCSINTTELPATMPTTGEGIVGLADTDILDTGTTVLVTNDASVYMMDENRVFQPVG